MNKESQSQQAGEYSLSLKLENNCSKLLGIKPNLSNKKGQEEIVGFVVIVVLVSVVMVVLLGIFLREGPKVERESGDIYQYLGSVMEYTSSCAINYEPAYSKIGELIRDCQAGKLCINGESACEALEKNLKEILDESWEVGEDRPIKGYILNSTYKDSASEESILELSKGECAGSYTGAEYASPAFPGKIITSLVLCS